MGKYKYLANNIALFTISNFVSKILVFLLVPFYTNVLTTAEYGTIDVMQTTLLLLVPVLTVNMGEAALRFGIERGQDRPQIFRIGIKYVVIAQCTVLVLGLLAGIFLTFPPFRLTWMLIVFFILLFFADSLYEYMILFLQGCEEVRFVVTGSVFSTLILICSNLLFLLVFRMGLPGYFISQILSYGLSFLLMLLLVRNYRPSILRLSEAAEETKQGSGQQAEAEPKDRDGGRSAMAAEGKQGSGLAAVPEGKSQALEREMLDYGKPMILYSTGAWINNAADRYFVSLMCGIAVNGIYGVAYKIPSILTVFQRIFAQAWQMSATKSLEEDKEPGSGSLAEDREPGSESLAEDREPGSGREISGTEETEKAEAPEKKAAEQEVSGKNAGTEAEGRQTGLLSAEFYSQMYDGYLSFMVLGCAALILIVRPLSAFLFRKDFFEAWYYVPSLLVSVVFGAMTGFLGSICLAYKDSKAMGLATGIGALVNVLLNTLLIPGYQAMGAAVATAVSYFIMYAMAFFFVRRHVRLKTAAVRNIAAFLLLSMEAAVMTRGEGSPFSYLLCGAVFAALLMMEHRFIKDSIEALRRLMQGFFSQGRV